MFKLTKWVKQSDCKINSKSRHLRMKSKDKNIECETGYMFFLVKHHTD